jgi:hypothetical protein
MSLIFAFHSFTFDCIKQIKLIFSPSNIKNLSKCRKNRHNVDNFQICIGKIRVTIIVNHVTTWLEYQKAF